MSRQLRDQALRYLNKGVSEFHQSLYKDALHTLKKAEQLAQKAQALDVLSNILSIIGCVMNSIGMYDDSFKNYTIALKLQEDLVKSEPTFNIQIAMTLNNLGNLLARMGRMEEAKERYERALKMHEKLLESKHDDASYQYNVATTLNNLGALVVDMGRLEEAKQRYERALKMHEKLLESEHDDTSYQYNVATTLNNLGTLLMGMGRLEEAKQRYERALKMHEKLLENDHDNVPYQISLASCLNNLGILLALMGILEEAKQRYEGALKIHEKLLESDRSNSAYQSNVAGTLNNLGTLLMGMGRIEEAKQSYESALKMRMKLLEIDRSNIFYQARSAETQINLGHLMVSMDNIKEAKRYYENSLNTYSEPMQYMTIRTKSAAILRIIQLGFNCAEKETNLSKKQEYFKNVYILYNQHTEFFIQNKLEHEGMLARGAGLGAHIQYLILNAKNETNSDKRIEEYEKCKQEVKKIAETENDEKLKELWSSVMYFLDGRQLVNKAIKYDPPDKELVKQAVERFKLAKDIYKHANVCYCIYTVLLEIESIEIFDDNAISRMKLLLQSALDTLPEEMDATVKSAFREIEILLEKRNMKPAPEVFIKLNRCITKIDYYALREHFNHIYQKIASYLEEPFSPNVFYNNWTLTFTFDEPEKVLGKLTIRAGDSVLFEEPLGKRHKIYIEEYRPRLKEETITFSTENGKNVTRQIYYSDEIKCDNDRIEVYILEHDCKRSITRGYFIIAIAQLKYDLYKESNAIKIKNDDAYLKKVTSILDSVKGKADLIVFPEFSIPFDYLPALKQYSDSTGIVIIAGSHYVTEDNLDKYCGLFDAEFGENDLLKNISPVIFPSSKIMHTEKIIGAKVERRLFFEEGMKHGILNRIFKLRDNVTCGIMICFDFLNDELRQRITDACNIIIIPQSNPGTERFHNTGKIEIENLRGAGNKAYIMASGIFTFNGEKEIMGGDSGVILTLDKDSHNKQDDAIISSIDGVKEQFILLASLNMNFNSSRDTQMGQIPMISELIHIFEKNEIINSKKDNPQSFIDLFEKIYSCGDKVKLKQLLKDNELLIKNYSPLMNKYIENLENLSIDQIKSRCQAVVIK